MARIILASGSPRRKEILQQVGITYTAIPSAKEEIMSTMIPEDLVKELSSTKAWDVAEHIEGPAVVLGADTIVAHHDKILGKPKDKEDAFRMIKSLQNDIHQVYTGVTILVKDETDRSNWRYQTFSVETKVLVAPMTDLQINRYIATGEPMDKAGAYAIQGLFAPYIQEIRGDYYNVVGFPIAAICKAANEMGINLFES